VWHSGPRPELELKHNGEFLRGRLALFWTGNEHDTPELVNRPRDFDAIERAGKTARDAVWRSDLAQLAEGVRQSYAMQLGEGMKPLPPDVPGALAGKYSGGGFGGYAVFLFATREQRDAACTRQDFRAIEPYVATR
jgi:hypothetical protein